MILDCGHEEDKGSPATVAGRTVQGWTFTLALDGKRKICHACACEQVLDCGHKIGPHSAFTGGYGTTPDGRRICYECCAADDRKRMSETGRATLYLCEESGSRTVTNWPGSLRIPCRVRRGRHNIAGTRRDIWFDFQGERWHGTQYGENTQLAHCRRLKRQA